MYNNFNEHLSGLWGRLKVEKIYLDGSAEFVYEEDNLITTLAKNIVLEQLYYPSGTGTPLSYAKVGIGGATDVSGLILKTPTVGMTDLYTPSISVPIFRTAYNTSTPNITLVAQVGNSQGNGLKINEAGFFSSSGKMFNIKTFPFVLKDKTFSINLTWVLGM